jgi:hypothetical protein
MRDKTNKSRKNFLREIFLNFSGILSFRERPLPEELSDIAQRIKDQEFDPLELDRINLSGDRIRIMKDMRKSINTYQGVVANV